MYDFYYQHFTGILPLPLQIYTSLMQRQKMSNLQAKQKRLQKMIK